MSYNDKIDKVIKTQKIRNGLHKIGIYNTIGPTGPTGPRGNGINIHGTYSSLDELIKKHPTGNDGDCYIVDNALYVWDNDKQEWESVGNIEGPTGPKGEQGDKGEQGNVGPAGPKGDKGEQGDVGPTGPKGDKGEQGDIGPTGPTGRPSPTGYDAIAFISLVDTKKEETVQFGNGRIIPSNNDYIAIENGTDIVIKRASTFEIVLCGRISGVTTDTGASFSLVDKTTGDVISDLIFNLNAGSTADMDFSEMTVVDISPSRLQIKTTITGNKSNEINFTLMNILLKSYTT